jgi:hypothetical protein
MQETGTGRAPALRCSEIPATPEFGVVALGRAILLRTKNRLLPQFPGFIENRNYKVERSRAPKRHGNALALERFAHAKNYLESSTSTKTE